MGNFITRTWRAIKSSVRDWVQKGSASAGRLNGLRMVLSGLAPGLWASNHLEETRHITGWSFIAIRALSIQAAQAQVSADRDPAADPLAGLSRKQRRKVSRHKSTHPSDIDRDGDGFPDKRPLPRHHPLLRLLRRPNIEQSGETFRFQLAQQMAATGSGYVWLVRNGMGVPIELYIIPTALMMAQAPSREYPRGSYRVAPMATLGVIADDEWTTTGTLGGLLATGGVIDARDIKAIRWPHALNPSDGQSPLAAGSLMVDTAEQADRSRWYNLKNAASPGLIFKILAGESANQDDLDAFRAELRARNSGTQNTGKDLLVPEGLDFERAERSAVEMDFSSSYPQLRDAVLALFGVPPIACGITEAGSYSAFYAALKQFTEITVQPMLDLIAGELTECLSPHYGGNGTVINIRAKKIDDPELLLRQLAQDLAKWSKMADKGCCTINEFRQGVLGLPPVEWGNVPVGSPPPGQQAPPGPGMPPGAAPAGPGGAPNANAGDAPPPQLPTQQDTGITVPTKEAPPGRPGTGEFAKRHGGHAFTSTQVNLPRHLAKPILAFGRDIPSSILADAGRETEIHATILYGLHDEQPDRVRDLLRRTPPVQLTLGGLAVFQSEKYDVLYISVLSQDLHRLHHLLADHLPHSDTHPQYTPHVTVAYLQPGEGAAYVGDDRFDGLSVTIPEVIFSPPTAAQCVLPLTGFPTQPLKVKSLISIEEIREAGRAAYDKLAPKDREAFDAFQRENDPDRIEAAGKLAYGLCPLCGRGGVMRERRVNGNDTCANGHVYPSKLAVPANDGKSANWDEDKHPRDGGQFASKPGADSNADDKPDKGKEPTPREKWQAEKAQLEAAHEQAVEKWHATCDQIDADFEREHQAWQSEVNAIGEKYQRDRAAWQEKEQALRAQEQALDDAASAEVDDKQILKEAVWTARNAAQQTPATQAGFDATAEEAFLAANAALPAAYGNSFRATHGAQSRQILAAAGVPEKALARLDAVADKLAGKLEARAAKAAALAPALVAAARDMEAGLRQLPDEVIEDPGTYRDYLRNNDMEDSDANRAAYQTEATEYREWERQGELLTRKHDQLDRQHSDLIDSLDEEWDRAAEKVSDYRTSLLDPAREQIQEQLGELEEAEPTAPEEVEPAYLKDDPSEWPENAYRPEPEQPDYPDEPEPPEIPEEPEEEEPEEPEEEEPAEPDDEDADR